MNAGASKIGKKICIAAAVELAAIVAIGAIVWSRLPAVSTHHAQIRIETPEYERDKERMLQDYERVVQTVEAWADPAGFYRLPADTNLPRQRWFGSGTERNERIAWFQEKNPQDKSFPREVMIACDPDGPFDIQALLAEGYSRHPSRELQAIYESLRQRLEGLRPGNVRGSIW